MQTDEASTSKAPRKEGLQLKQNRLYETSKNELTFGARRLQLTPSEQQVFALTECELSSKMDAAERKLLQQLQYDSRFQRWQQLRAIRCKLEKQRQHWTCGGAYNSTDVWHVLRNAASEIESLYFPPQRPIQRSSGGGSSPSSSAEHSRSPTNTEKVHLPNNSANRKQRSCAVTDPDPAALQRNFTDFTIHVTKTGIQEQANSITLEDTGGNTGIVRAYSTSTYAPQPLGKMTTLKTRSNLNCFKTPLTPVSNPKPQQRTRGPSNAAYR